MLENLHRQSQFQNRNYARLILKKNLEITQPQAILKALCVTRSSELRIMHGTSPRHLILQIDLDISELRIDIEVSGFVLHFQRNCLF